MAINVTMDTKVKNRWVVRLDGVVTGHIHWVEGRGYRYQPKGSKHFGEWFPNMTACCESLAGEE